MRDARPDSPALLAGFLEAVSLRIRLFRTVRRTATALLAAAPVSAAGLALAGSHPLPPLLAGTLPFVLALGVVAVLARRWTVDLRQAAVYADLRLGTRGALPALAEELGRPSFSPMGRALWASVRDRLPARPASLCRFPLPARIWGLFAVPLLLGAGIAVAAGRKALPAAEPLNRTLLRKVETTLRAMDRDLPLSGPDAASEKLQTLARLMVRGGRPQDLAREAAAAARDLADRRRKLEQTAASVDRIFASHPTLEPLRAGGRPEDPAAREGLRRFSAGLDRGTLPPASRQAMADAAEDARRKTGARSGLGKALTDLKEALARSSGPRAARALHAVATEAAELRKLANRTHRAEVRAESVAISLSGPGGRALLATEGRDEKPGPAGRTEAPARPPEATPVRTTFEKAYLEALASPDWDPEYDEVVKGYFELLREK